MAALVIAEHDNHSIKGGTLNAVTAALKCGGDVTVLVAGNGCSAAASAAAAIAGVSKVISVEAAGLADGLQRTEARRSALQASRDSVHSALAEQIAYVDLFTAFGGAALPAPTP